MTHHLPTRGFHSAAFAMVTVAALFASAGCDRATTPGAGIAPATVPAVVASITTGSATFSPLSSCGTSALLTPDLNLIITSTNRDVAVDEVTLHLLDGSNLGGPGITIPRTDLNDRFATTIVRAGTSRTFGFRPTFRCGESLPWTIRGVVGIVDATGARSTLSAMVALP